MLKELIKLRKKTGLNQTDFALKVGCTSKHISNMERGTAPVTTKTLFKYAKVFGWHYSLTLHCS